MAQGLKAFASALLLGAALTGGAQAQPAVQAIAGKWEIEQRGAPRKCLLTLGGETAGQGRQLRFPATCRRALPVLNQVAAWAPGEGGLPQLLDAAGKPALVFRRGAAANGAGEATGPDGQVYVLARNGLPPRAAASAQSQAQIAATAAARPTVVDPARAPAAEGLPGRYSVMRQPGREICRLELKAGPAPAPAVFDGRCVDVGLTIFDPVGWRYADGRLTLMARRGHSVDLVSEGGVWRKDPAVGAALLLKKLAP